MITVEQTAAPSTPPTWLDSLARVVTVWGLGIGTAIGATLIAALGYHSGGRGLLLSMAVTVTVAATAAGSALYLDYVKSHVRVDSAGKNRSAKVVSSAATLVYLFVAASLFSLLMLPLLVVGIVYARARTQRGQPWRRRAEMFIGEAMPRIAFL